MNPLPSIVEATPDTVRDTLRHVIDPELGINIVDLGLVYGIVAIDEGAATVAMTLTTPGCPLHASIEEAVIRAVETRHPDLERVEVDTRLGSAVGHRPDFAGRPSAAGRGRR